MTARPVSPASPMRFLRRWASSSRARRAGRSSKAISPGSDSEYRAELDRLRPGTATSSAGRRRNGVAGELAAWGAAGLRLRLRGPDRCAVGAARGARGPRRGDGLASLRAGPPRPSRRWSEPQPTCPSSRGRGSRSWRLDPMCAHLRSRTLSAGLVLRDIERRKPPKSTARFAFFRRRRPPWHARARRRGAADADSRRTRARRRLPSVCPRVER